MLCSHDHLVVSEFSKSSFSQVIEKGVVEVQTLGTNRHVKGSTQMPDGPRARIPSQQFCAAQISSTLNPCSLGDWGMTSFKPGVRLIHGITFLDQLILYCYSEHQSGMSDCPP